MSPRRKGYLTREEHEAKLKAEGKYEAMLERHRLLEEERQKRAEELGRAEAPLVAAIRAAGYPVDSVWDLVNTRDSYPKALPVLLDHLQRPYPGEIRDGIARALAVREATYAHPLFVKLWRDEPDRVDSAKQGLACAVAATALPEDLDEIIGLVRDARLGPTRGLLLYVLERADEPRAWAALMEMGTDPEISPEVQHLLKKRKRRQSRCTTKK